MRTTSLMNKRISTRLLLLVAVLRVKSISSSEGHEHSEEKTSSEAINETLNENSSKNISCESIVEVQWDDGVVADLQTCCLFKKTSIRSTGVKIAQLEDASMEPTEALMFNNNKKIFYLPIGLDKTFDSLIAFSARNCSLKAIVKENFEDLVDLQLLWLDQNFIESVSDNTFEDLKSLVWLDLSKNRINSINGETFRLLLQLNQVSLLDNKCINETFRGKQLTRLRRQINENCSFNDESKSHCKIEELLQKQTKDLLTVFTKSFDEKKMFQSEIARLTAENSQQTIRIGNLENKLSSANDENILLREKFNACPNAS